MAELRKHGVSLSAAQECADYFEEAITATERTFVPFYYLIEPDSGTAFPLPAKTRNEPLHKIIKEHGPTLLILDIFEFLDSVSTALDDPDGLLTSERKPIVVMERGSAK
jgi:hypothetical protein